jgi:hypothetical protein
LFTIAQGVETDPGPVSNSPRSEYQSRATLASRVRNSWWICQIYFISESWGWMVEVFRDDRLFQGHRHLLRADAMKWADEMRHDIETDLEAERAALRAPRRAYGPRTWLRCERI